MLSIEGNVDVLMVNKTLTTKQIGRSDVFLNFFWKGYNVSCYWDAKSKEFMLINSLYEFTEDELAILKANFSKASFL